MGKTMPLIIDQDGTRWVDPAPRNRRAPSRALRFASLTVGAQLMQKPRKWHVRGLTTYYLVTDLWFDPVAGQSDDTAGRMVGYVQIGPDGEPRGRKSPTTIRGLASQGFEYADMDYIAMCKTRAPEMEAGRVVGIGRGHAIRARPKTPQPRGL